MLRECGFLVQAPFCFFLSYALNAKLLFSVLPERSWNARERQGRRLSKTVLQGCLQLQPSISPRVLRRAVSFTSCGIVPLDGVATGSCTATTRAESCKRLGCSVPAPYEAQYHSRPQLPPRTLNLDCTYDRPLTLGSYSPALETRELNRSFRKA